ncbi:unnamed protein product [Aureobasidium uvarum]|uniref:Uncharacterized protein n=1 Tax=Aureobasidium uvarum TaxID=2773716 RepID=A0A9N8PUZ7_9PEZI|nr:unnamed protein product [Aureobasidium uvarum]
MSESVSPTASSPAQTTENDTSASSVGSTDGVKTETVVPVAASTGPGIQSSDEIQPTAAATGVIVQSSDEVQPTASSANTASTGPVVQSSDEVQPTSSQDVAQSSVASTGVPVSSAEEVQPTATTQQTDSVAPTDSIPAIVILPTPSSTSGSQTSESSTAGGIIVGLSTFLNGGSPPLQLTLLLLQLLETSRAPTLLWLARMILTTPLQS